MFSNLISNALKFTEKRHLKVDVKYKRIDKNMLDFKFSVEDTGMGIEKHSRKRIFESFWHVYDKSTWSHTVTGLWLTICIRLLKLMNSRLDLVREKGLEVLLVSI